METFSLDYALCTCLLLFALGSGVWFYFFCRAQRIKKVLQTLGSAAEVYAGILRQEKLRREQAYREQLRREAERRRQEEIRREQAFQEAERAKAEQEKNEAEINKIKVLFNGIWLTPQQFGFCSKIRWETCAGLNYAVILPGWQSAIPCLPNTVRKAVAGRKAEPKIPAPDKTVRGRELRLRRIRRRAKVPGRLLPHRTHITAFSG